ncbi:hypothetical protein MHYP_G00230750 [Metynnis hypsauchen]
MFIFGALLKELEHLSSARRVNKAVTRHTRPTRCGGGTAEFSLIISTQEGLCVSVSSVIPRALEKDELSEASQSVSRRSGHQRRASGLIRALTVPHTPASTAPHRLTAGHGPSP